MKRITGALGAAICAAGLVWLSGCAGSRSRGAAGEPREASRSTEQLRKACRTSAAACESLGAALFDTDKGGATAAFQAGCESEEASPARINCCMKLGLSNQYGWGVPIDMARARSLYAFACDHGLGAGCAYLGLLEFEGGDDGELPLAAAHFTKACRLGFYEACNNLGVMYSLGKGVEANPAMAIRFLELGCDGGELRSCTNLGSRLLIGEGTPKNPTRGRALIAKACAGGLEEACALPEAASP